MLLLIYQTYCVSTKNDIEKINRQLEKELTSQFWKGDKKRFGTNGSQEGLFLLPNYKLKKTWFPTELKIKGEPFEAIIENNGKNFLVEYKDEKIKIVPVL